MQIISQPIRFILWLSVEIQASRPGLADRAGSVHFANQYNILFRIFTVSDLQSKVQRLIVEINLTKRNGFVYGLVIGAADWCQTNNLVHALDTVACKLHFKYSSHMAPWTHYCAPCLIPWPTHTCTHTHLIHTLEGDELKTTRVSSNNQSYPLTVIVLIYYLSMLHSISIY